MSESDFTGDKKLIWDHVVKVAHERTTDPSLLQSIFDTERERIKNLPLEMTFVVKLTNMADIWRLVELNDIMNPTLTESQKTGSIYQLVHWCLSEGRDEIYRRIAANVLKAKKEAEEAQANARAIDLSLPNP